MFDFTTAMKRLIHHISSTHPEFAHVRSEQVLVSFIQTRTPGIHGVYASCQPLRFKDGERTKKHRGRVYAMPQLFVEGHEILYIIYFAMPRFMNLDFDAKMVTVFHELYHISQKFNGDIRRFRGKYYAHGHSRKVYNERVKAFSDEYLSMPESDKYTAFLRSSFAQVHAEHGGILGARVRQPKPKPVQDIS